MISHSSNSRSSLRKQLRNRRRALSHAQQQLAAQTLVKRLRSHPLFLRSQHVACYMAADGEMSLQRLMQTAQAMGKTCYLPVLHPLKKNTLWFCQYREGDALTSNRFGLAEPAFISKRITPNRLDLVLMPLVGFDRRGNRLGMGGGFYDRTFSFKQDETRHTRMPVLMGIAHSCQKVESLDCESWDIPLDYIATEKEIFEFKTEGF